MRRSSNVPLLIALRRRARTTALCFVVLIIITISLFKGHSSDLSVYEEAGSNNAGRVSRFLEVVTPWTRERPVYTSPHPAVDPEATGIDKIPEVPPTLQENDEDAFSGTDAVDSAADPEQNVPKHTWDGNGLLVVNPNAPHPIYELVHRAEAQWNEKQKRASKTIEQAVKEYKRRYKRSPPKGFDHWWNYVQKHNVHLPDEYDQIYRDLEPYWGIDPHDLQAAQAEIEATSDTFTLGKPTENDAVSLVNMTVSEARKNRISDYLSWGAKPQLDILNDVYRYIPPFRATFSPHDGPSELVDWTWRKAAIDAARNGTYLKPEGLPQQDRSGWSGACPPDSPLYLNPPRRDEEPTPQTPKTFIHDHRASMDPCYHPQHVLTHGTFLTHGTGPNPKRFPAPLLGNCASALHGDIRATSMQQASEFAIDDPRWDDKEDDRLFWRGTPTGMWHHSGVNWRSSQRVRLVNLTGSESSTGQILNTGSSDFAYVTYLNPDVPPGEPVGEPAWHTRRKANNALMDVSFSGPLTGCEAGAVCDEMQSELTWGQRVEAGVHGAGRYKYLLDVDGNGWSSRFRRLMSSHALVFKSTVFPEWWTDRAQPWVHYVPVQLDYSDLYDSLVFFGGGPEGEGAHEEMARKIASAGREWVEKFWRKEDVTAYMFRLWLEYARVMSLDRDIMNFHLS